MTDTNGNGSGAAWKILASIAGVLVLLAGFILNSLESRLTEIERTCVRKDGITMAPETRARLEALEHAMRRMQERMERP